MDFDRTVEIDSRILKGRPVSSGVAFAPAFIFVPEAISISKTKLNGVSANDAIAQVERVFREVDNDLAALIAGFPADEQEQAKIFAAHREIIADEELRQTIFDHIRIDQMSVETAIDSACETFIELLKNIADETIALRAADLVDVRGRLIRKLRGESNRSLACLSGNCILVAHDLLPSDTASMDRAHVVGIVTEVGSETSHTAILARSFRIPALVGIKNALQTVADGQPLLLDAETGELTISPQATQIEQGQQKRDAWQNRCNIESEFLCKPAVTRDGKRIQIGMNIGSDEDRISEYSDFVGLFRTEFLFMNADHLPTEEEQFAAYRRVLENAAGKTVTLRTLDIGGDKTLSYLQLPKEENPFLGKRALRLCFDEPELFSTQLCAALRASAFGKLQIMFPMVGSIDDIRKAKTFVADAMANLRTRKEAFDENIRLGIMIEIPSIAMISDLAAREVDFASIGSNDLSQYLFAADRMNPELNAYCQPFAPAFLRILKTIISSYQAAGKEISMCGEMAGDAKATSLLAGIGLSKFSMNASSFGGVKKALSEIRLSDAQSLADQAMNLATQQDVIDLLQRS